MFERVAIAAALVGIADLLAKHAIVMSLVPGERRPLLDGLVWLVDVPNARGAMGLFGAPPPVMIALALVTLGFVAFWLRRALRFAPLAQIGFGLIAGGALGNIVDRIAHGYVIDFIEPRGFFAFNLADAGITCGLILIAIVLARPAARTW